MKQMCWVILLFTKRKWTEEDRQEFFVCKNVLHVMSMSCQVHAWALFCLNPLATEHSLLPLPGCCFHTLTSACRPYLPLDLVTFLLLFFCTVLSLLPCLKPGPRETENVHYLPQEWARCAQRGAAWPAGDRGNSRGMSAWAFFPCSAFFLSWP